jgi:hypothetical protein
MNDQKSCAKPGPHLRELLELLAQHRVRILVGEQRVDNCGE